MLNSDRSDGKHGAATNSSQLEFRRISSGSVLVVPLISESENEIKRVGELVGRADQGLGGERQPFEGQVSPNRGTDEGAPSYDECSPEFNQRRCQIDQYLTGADEESV